MGILTVFGTTVGTAIGGPGGGVVGSQVGARLPGILTNLFGGAGRDAQRQARVDWFADRSLAGSPKSFNVLRGGVANTASHESPMYTVAIAMVTQQRPDVANAGYNSGGPYWDTTDNESSDKMRAAVNAELATLSATSAAAPGVTTLPLMTTTASSAAAAPAPGGMNPLMLGVIAFVVVVGLFLVMRGRG